MAARAMWKGILKLDDLSVPVKLYAAVETRNIQFNLLAKEGVRISQRMVDPDSGDIYEYREARRGIEIESDRFVLIEPDELEAIEAQPSREIAITRFVDPEEISHQWYDRPYYLGPDGNEIDYFCLVRALEKNGLEGLARWTMRKKEYIGSLRAIGGYLMLVTLRHAGEVIEASELEPPEGRKLEKKERELAAKLIEALEDDFDPDDYNNEYRERVVDLIESKAKGKKIKIQKPTTNGEVSDDLSASLEATLKAMKK